jgi:predicted transcriptional regulator YdeE
MTLSIHTDTFALDIYGFSGIAATGDYAATAFKLSDRMWQTVKAANLKNKGKNIWVYDRNNEVFAGVELEEPAKSDLNLQHKKIVMTKYAYFKHVGAYKLLPIVGQKISAELKVQGFDKALPYIEIYGHWTNDETKLETELFYNLR